MRNNCLLWRNTVSTAAAMLLSAVSCPDGLLAADGATSPQRRTLTRILQPASSAAGPVVTITYEAAVFDPPEAVPTSGDPTWNTSAPELTFKAVFLANKHGDSELIVRGFAPLEREKVRSTVNKADLLEKNTALYARITKALLLQKTFYGGYVILTVSQEDATGNQWRANYAFKQTDEGWLLTNDLANDRVYSQLIDMLTPKLPEKTN